MIKASKFAIVIAVVGPLAVATAGQSPAASISPAADVRYRRYVARPYQYYDPYYGTYWDNVAPYLSGGYDPYYGTYWDGWAPF
jgi:hypothetical protein